MADDLTQHAQTLIDHARRNKLWLATAESCTAGALAMTLSAAEGAATAFHGGLVTYSKAQKIATGVPGSLIEAHTAVSAEVANALVEAALANSPADLACAITGVAGPAPDEDGNPVGLVFVAAGQRGLKPVTECHHFTGDREAICRAAISRAIELAIRLCNHPLDRPSGRNTCGT